MEKVNEAHPDPGVVIYITCPFCNEKDFDLVGLKIHFYHGHCKVYNELESHHLIED